ncbi:MAG: citrate synthase [Chloroflexi bacterium]|nr:citrate synthase [Chloroflexota bacterium]
MVSKGLEGIVALSSAISTIVEEESKLIYRGIDVRELADNASFEEVVYLLWHGTLPTRAQLVALRTEINAAFALPDPVARGLEYYPQGAEPMDVLRTAVSALAAFDPDTTDSSRPANLRKAARILAQVPAVVGTFHRLRSGAQPVRTLPDLSFAGNVLLLLTGERPDDQLDRDFDQVLVLHADHELNASTFAARTAASTLSDMHAAVVAGLAALKGPLHGGANRAVMDMLVEIGDPSRVAEEIRARLARHDRIMGFGHRVYKHGDPRVAYMRELSRKYGERSGDVRWYQMSRQIEEMMLELKHLYPNVDYYAGSFYHALGLPADLYPAVFATSRMSGWLAHIMEQFADNRLIRPRAEYIGPMGRHYVPIDRRG